MWQKMEGSKNAYQRRGRATSCNHLMSSIIWLTGGYYMSKGWAVVFWVEGGVHDFDNGRMSDSTTKKISWNNRFSYFMMTSSQDQPHTETEGVGAPEERYDFLWWNAPFTNNDLFSNFLRITVFPTRAFVGCKLACYPSPRFVLHNTTKRCKTPVI